MELGLLLDSTRVKSGQVEATCVGWVLKVGMEYRLGLAVWLRSWGPMTREMKMT